MTSPWKEFTIAPSQTYHLLGDRSAYEPRFDEVLKFHEPGLAAARDASGAFHIDPAGSASYITRYIRTFGYYEGRAAIETASGCFHILADGSRLHPDSYEWCGNFQENRCTVRHPDGLYSHIRPDGASAYPARYRYAGDYHDGSAVVQREDGLHTHIGRDGDLIHQRWFEDLDVFHKGYARARDEAGWHHVDPSGRSAYDRRFKAAEPFYNGQARVEDFDGSLLVIDESGQVVVRLREPLRTPLEGLSADLVGFWRTQTIRAAVEVGVFEALPALAADLDRRLRLSGTSTRLLRALGELDLVRQDKGGTWYPTERGSLLTKNHDQSMANAAGLWGTEHYDAWARLPDALRSGRPAFEEIHGEAFFPWLSHRPSDLDIYQGALSSYARHDYASLARIVDFSAHSQVVDAGGGNGELLFSLLNENPYLHGTVMERPEVVADAHVPSDLTSRCEVAVGDLFAPWPVQGDAVILARVLHDWPDDQALVILRNAREALTEGGRLYLTEMVRDEHANSGGMLDLNMLVITGGRERTQTDFEGLLSNAGFRLIERRDLPSISSVLIAESM